MKNPPVTLAKIAIGDGTIASGETFELLPVVSTLLADGVLHNVHILQVSVLETYPQIIGYDTDVFEYFREQFVLMPQIPPFFCSIVPQRSTLRL
jgi:carboxypeptidase D